MLLKEEFSIKNRKQFVSFGHMNSDWTLTALESESMPIS